MIRASALVPVAAAVSWQEIVDNVHSSTVSWQAAVPAKFGAPEDVKDFLGAYVPGDAEYVAPDVIDIPVANGVPDAFDSATNWPQCAATIANVRDQSACGSCWAFGSVESFEDRACIATGTPVHYSPEDTAFNSNAGMGCNGGNTAWNWFKSSGVVTGGDYTDIGSGDTCLPYSLAPCAHHVPPSAKYPACPGEGPSPRPGRKCSESGYSGAYASDKVKAMSAFSVRGVSQIQTEIMTNGPLYVSFTVYDDFPTYKSGVYHRTSYNQLGGHAVENVGWGTLSGQAYWRIKNSWNEEWGDGGHFKIVRGSNECGIEGGVSGGTVAGSPVLRASAEDACSIYDTSVADGTCGEAQLDCQYVAPAKAFRNTLKDGHCADEGYSVAAGSQDITVPVVGKITISLFKKALGATGACTADDQAALADPQVVGDKQDACGKKNLGLSGIQHDGFVSCVQSDLGISAACSECYYDVAKYGFANCKAACLLGWCKSGCLSCTQPAQDTLGGCAGFAPAAASPCEDQVV